MKLRYRAILPVWIELSASTIVTLEQIRMKVMIAVVVMPRYAAGDGQLGLPMRSAPYAAMAAPKVIASPARNDHIPSLPRFPGVSDGSS